MNGRQIAVSPARYALEDAPASTDACRSCGADLVLIEGRWHALEARWPNLAHCHYRSGSSVGHDPATTDSEAEHARARAQALKTATRDHVDYPVTNR